MTLREHFEVLLSKHEERADQRLEDIRREIREAQAHAAEALSQIIGVRQRSSGINAAWAIVITLTGLLFAAIAIGVSLFVSLHR